MKNIFRAASCLILLCFPEVTVISSCNHTTKQKTDPVQKTSTSNTVHKKANKGDTLVIDRPSVVIFSFDSLRWVNVRGRMTVNEFASDEHECESLTTNTRTSVKEYWHQLHLYEIATIRWLRFVSKKNEENIIDLDSITYPCGAYLFDGQKNPRFSDMMNIGNDMDYYFKK